MTQLVEDVRNVLRDEARRQGVSGGQANRVIDAAIGRVQGLVDAAADTLRTSARGLGASDHQVEDALTSAGLFARPAPATGVAASGSDGDLGRRVDELARTVEALVRAARSRGITV
jgi:hypothetical protein